MDSDRWEKVVRLYESACDLPVCEQRALLAAASGGDDELRLEVESLLRQDVSRYGVLERVAQESRSTTGADVQHLPESIGSYRILRLVGEGGMGAVYEAEQLNPRRTVALKVVKSGWVSQELLRRFEQESDVLGRLQNAGIAQVYEAGVTHTSHGPQPYFAMEFIRGVSLKQFSESRRLDARQRTDLIVKVCDAVHHAHERGIIHRDLKPANILVDGTGQPKVLDFGVARVIDSDAQITRHTGLGELVGTLAYMSPEQTRANPSELDARSDVYSLGVVLYELLAERLPYEAGGQVLNAVRTICEEEPPPLGLFNRACRGDLETIASKALEKDKARRYASAADLAADLRHYLADEPILAKPPSTSYQIRKFAVRHKLIVCAVVALFFVLAVGITVSSWEAVRAVRAERAALLERNRAMEEKQRADIESAAAKAVVGFLQNDLLLQAGASAQSSPETKPDPDLKVRTALDRAAARVAGKFESQPAVEARIRQTIGVTYRDLSLFPQAQQQLERALGLWRGVLNPDRTEVFGLMNDLALVYTSEGRYAAAEQLLNEALERERRIVGVYHPDTLNAMNILAIASSGKGDYTRAESLFAKVLENYRHTLGDQHADTLAAMNNLATQYSNLEKHVEAEELYARVVEAKRRVLGDEHPSTLQSMNSLAVQYRFEGKYSKAEPILLSVLQVRRRTRGDQHQDTLASMNSLGLLYQAQGRYTEAEPLLSRNAEALRRMLGEDHPLTLASQHSLAELYRREGKKARAESMFGKVLAARRRTLGPDHPNTVNTLASLGGMKLEDRQYTEAEALLREALTAYQKKRSDSWRRYSTENMLGASLAGLGKRTEAQPLLIAGYEGLSQRRGSIPFENRAVLEEARQSIVHLYQKLGKTREAAIWAGAKPDAK